MAEHSDHSQYVRRVVLPSGKTIEVVYFEDQPAAAADAPRQDPGIAHEPDLHVCGSCGSQLVFPMEWNEAGATQWEVTLRCPDCEWGGTGVFAQETVERFDEELDRGTETLVRDLKRLMQANMEDEVERFCAALRSDAILPEDF